MYWPFCVFLCVLAWYCVLTIAVRCSHSHPLLAIALFTEFAGMYEVTNSSEGSLACTVNVYTTAAVDCNCKTWQDREFCRHIFYVIRGLLSQIEGIKHSSFTEANRFAQSVRGHTPCRC